MFASIKYLFQEQVAMQIIIYILCVTYNMLQMKLLLTLALAACVRQLSDLLARICEDF